MPRPRGPCANSREVQRHPEETLELVDKEVELGHILGLLDSKPIKGWCTHRLILSQNHWMGKRKSGISYMI